VICPACSREHAGPRDTFALAEKLSDVTRRAAAEADVYKALKFLHLNLFWLEGELRELCTDCTLESAAERATEAMPAWHLRTAGADAELPTPEPRIPGRVIDLGMRRRPTPSRDLLTIPRAEPKE
jgi:hypothetical protein